jgi:hypothetical protein
MINNLSELKTVSTYLKRIGAEPRSLKIAVIKEKRGQYWTDTAIIRFNKEGDVDAPLEFKPTDQEAADIKEEFKKLTFPELKKTAFAKNLPDDVKNASPDNVFEFRDESGNIVMIQLRREKRGEKSYIPYTFWSDEKWRAVEPDGGLPIWGIEQLKNKDVAFIHEGAKAARSIARMINPQTQEDIDRLAAHPWGEELKHSAHLGWIGGALSPHRTDWSVLTKLGVKRVYIVSDNDAPGVAAVPAIAYNLRCPTFHIQFTSEWPTSFDLADDFPQEMFCGIGSETYYTGPSFRSCTHPATWATDQIKNDKGKPTTILRESFKGMWAYVEAQDAFVCVEMPEIIRNDTTLNKMLSSFSHSNNTTSVLLKQYSGRSTSLCYKPGETGRVLTDNNSSAINLHTPTHVKSKNGNIQPFLDFIDYLIPNKKEQETLLDWCTTLIAKPHIKMDFGVLLVSEAQGIGKTTLASNILAPLVGQHNTSQPSEEMITNSAFNSWLSCVRLIVVNEIYSGHSWKAYNRLKGVITDKTIDVNKKFQNTYTIENYAHIVACSNSMKALKMDEDDRRWFYPEVSEKPWTAQQFSEFHLWLSNGGLSIIKDWAENRKTWIKKGERSPMTNKKIELIEESRSEAQKEVMTLAETMNSINEPIAITMKDISAWVKSQIKGNVFESDLELRKAMKSKGCIVAPERIKVFGVLQYVVLNKNEKWLEMINTKNKELDREVRLKTKKPNEMVYETI